MVVTWVRPVIAWWTHGCVKPPVDKTPTGWHVEEDRQQVSTMNNVPQYLQDFWHLGVICEDNVYSQINCLYDLAM